ncbi:uncharacterized protein PV09_05651 [Verruconis gallopava]|uniref:Ribosomal protein S17 n=1 Tax=Verruconis gallopava TaxID=253628 RepID=A0A0D1YR10_9PEZI|nr:uncharacterized protein PV09_05651 [Verruconis gallopava]KIW02992.1 hypothetical protein PV09_05651 [Verruconis gallopava]
MASMEPRRHITGVVVSAGKMIKTVKVRVPKQVWNKRLQKYYSEPQTLLVSDPTNSTREGDVVTLEGGRRISKHVRHVVAGIIAPMGVPLSERAHIPSAAERLAAVEAKRVAKDLRQAARGRWPALVRVREREARQAASLSLEEAASSMTLDSFVKMYRKKKPEEGAAESLVLDFLCLAKYKVLQGEVPLHAQVAALAEVKGKLVRERAKLEEQLNAGIFKRTGRDITLSEREEMSKQKLQLWQQIHQIERSISHFNSYVKEVNPKNETRRQELKNNPIEWYDLVMILNMTHWEQNIAALDLWGRAMLEEAAKRDVGDISRRAGLARADSKNLRGATLHESNGEDHALAAATESLGLESKLQDKAVGESNTTEQPEPIVNTPELEVETRHQEMQSDFTSEEGLSPSVGEPHVEHTMEQKEEVARNLQEDIEKPSEAEAHVEQQPAEAEQEKEERKSGGFWNLFRRK